MVFLGLTERFRKSVSFWKASGSFGVDLGSFNDVSESTNRFQGFSGGFMTIPVNFRGVSAAFYGVSWE